MNYKKINYSSYVFLAVVLILFSINSKAQLTRTWVYSYNHPANLEAAGNCIVHLDHGVTITGGYYKSNTNPDSRNILVFTDDAGTLIKADSSTIGFGYSKIIKGGTSSYFAVGTLLNDSSTARNILIAKIDSASLNINYFVPDSNPAIGYDPMDMILLNNNNILIGSRRDDFPMIQLSLTCMDDAGNLVWQTLDTTFEIKYDLKLLPDEIGGFFAAGTGRDILTSEDFIFVAHFDLNGIRDWFFRQASTSTSFADFLDIVKDHSGHLWTSGVLMDSTGQVGTLLKLDISGNLVWKHPVAPNPYLKILSDENNFIYGATVPSNGLDVFTIEKLDSAGTFLYSTNFQLTGYFNSVLYDLQMLDGGNLAFTGDLYVLSFPKPDLYLAIYDTALNLVDYDIYNASNFLGESGRAVVKGAGNDLYLCGRLNYENQFETCNLGVLKYDLQIIDNIDKNKISTNFEFFPNPSTGAIFIKCENLPRGKNIFTVFDAFGKEVFTDYSTNLNGTSNYNLNLSEGLYYLTLNNGETRISKKLLIMQK